MKYTIIQEEPVQVIARENEDGTITTFTADPANSDYQAYLNPEVIDRGNGEFTSMTKAHYDELEAAKETI